MQNSTTSKEQEYRSRVERIRAHFKERKLDAIFVTDPLNVAYVSAFWEYVPIRMEAVLIPLDGECTFIVSKNEYEYACKVSWIEDIRYYTEFPERGRHQNPIELLTEVIHEKRLEKAAVGVERHSLPLGEMDRISAALPAVRFGDASPTLTKCRMVKSPYEVDMLKKAGKVAVAGWRAALEVAKPGMREFEVGQAARQAATETAAEMMNLESDLHHSPIVDGVQLIQSGPRSSISHGRGSLNRMKRGDMVAMCFCLTNQFKGYRVGFARNFALGHATEEMVKVYDLLFQAQQAAFAELRPGVKASHLDRLVRERIEKAGYGQFIEHRLGRGVGMLYAEAPDLKEGDDTVIEVGMCLSIEPAVYIGGKWGIEIEDSVHVTHDGFEFLTVAPEPELPVL
ncbi:MAG TPA: Xaa-Pro peptidase family protein [Alphaproteobacteria bacterium]|nr:Xaa-Pro peptidase family protein [Alphaproteobacteria bacterium]